MNKRISLCLYGSLGKWDQEGGYAHPIVEIDGESVTSAIEEMLEKAGVELVSDGLSPSAQQGIAQGTWILTLVRVKD